ncbi:hypothetical protein DRN86_03405 [Candidatus Geothermarchaeota archaeon]|nr:MAG: hypothetical protein DRN86_03405 [Candidatus Geothermarchaeota archaeon]
MKLKIEIIGPYEDYISYTGYLWLLEIRDLIENEYGIKTELKWIGESLDPNKDYPIVKVDDETFVGLPSEIGYLYEIIKSFIERRMGLKGFIEGDKVQSKKNFKL